VKSELPSQDRLLDELDSGVDPPNMTILSVTPLLAEAIRAFTSPSPSASSLT